MPTQPATNAKYNPDVGVDITNLRVASDPEAGYLGDITVVDSIFRAAYNDFTALRMDAGEGIRVINGESVKEVLRPYAKILLGEDERYAPVEGWNTTANNSLVSHVSRQLMVPPGDQHDMIMAAFAMTLARIVHVESAVESGSPWKHEVDAAISSFAKVMIGLEADVEV